MFQGIAELQRAPSKNNIWENEASGAARFSASFLGLECVPRSVWQQEIVQWLRGVMMLFKGKHCAIMRMGSIQQISAETSATRTRSQNFGCLSEVTQVPRAARRGWALPKMCLLKMFTELSPKNGSGPKYSLKLRLRTKLTSVTSASSSWSSKQRHPQDFTALDSTWNWAQQGMWGVRSDQTFLSPGIFFSFGTFCPNWFVPP